MNFFQNIPTELHLNGPNVRFSSVPLDATADITGVATFTAIGTASFPYNNTNGSYTFDWYFDNERILDAAEDSDSSAQIVTIGSAGISTITINGIGGDDDGKSIFAIVNYVPGPDENIIDYPAEGNGKSTSSTAILTAPPRIEISKQPISVVVGAGNATTFEVEASILPGGGNIAYQWQLEGTNLSNGTSTKTVQSSNDEFPTMELTSDQGDTATINWSQISTYNSFIPGRTYTLTVSGGNLECDISANGGGGGGSGFRNKVGSSGGLSEGRFTFLDGQTYKIQVGEAGQDGATVVNGEAIGAGGKPGGGDAPSDGESFNRSGAGGGYTGLFYNSVTQANAILIAAGGGGSSGDGAASIGGAGGGLEGNAGANPQGRGRSGLGGTQTAGGASGTAGTPGEAGSALQGGSGSGSGNGAAGGGGGYFGGGGGTNDGPGTGGGGSSYLHPTLITDGTTTTGGANNAEGNGSLTITRVTATKTVTTTVTGANTPNLTINSSDENFGGALVCRMTASNVIQSPVFSNTVSYDVVPARPLIKFEAYTFDNNYESIVVNLTPDDNDSNLQLDRNYFGSQYSIIQFHSLEKDNIISMEMFGAKGSDFSGNSGGEGGKSTIAFTAEKDVEYTLIGISNNSGVFLYRGSKLIAVVGAGGNAGTNGSGGRGGGVDVAGENGSSGGSGGSIPSTLSTDGVFGSIVNDYSTPPTLYTGDSIESTPNGGRVITCSKGSYWINQGVSPCSNNSSSPIQYVNIDGTTITNSERLIRGFKPGYTITATEGKGLGNGGNGGAGAQGGQGGNGGGGGGGSGYTDGSVTVVQSQSGGSTGLAGINMKTVSVMP